MEKYIGDLITEIRRDSQNADDIPTSSIHVGIATEDFLRYANYAQRKLQARILRVYPQAFESSIEISLVANQADYTIQDNLYLGTRIKRVEISRTGLVKDYLRLPPAHPYFQRNVGSWPTGYIRQNGTITLSPPPSVSAGTLRVRYQRALDTLDIRRAKIDGTPSGVEIHVHGPTDAAISSEEEAVIQAARYICISDPDGIPKLYNGKIASYNASTDKISLAADVSTYLVSGATLASLDDCYVTVGRYSTTHSALIDDAEQYITEYVSAKVFRRESKAAEGSTLRELSELETTLVRAYAIPDNDLKTIPVGDYDFMMIPYDDY